MSIESLERFYQEVLQDVALQEPFKHAKTSAAIIDIAVELGKEKGYNFNTQDLKKWLAVKQKAADGAELSDEQLNDVSGGSVNQEFVYQLFQFR